MKTKDKKDHPAVLKASVPLRRCVMTGDTVARRPATFSEFDRKDAKAIEGRVIYVHPEGRYHVVAFPGRLGMIRESFFGTLK